MNKLLRRFRRVLSVAPMLVLVPLLQACATIPDAQEPVTRPVELATSPPAAALDAPMSLIAVDFTHALLQINRLPVLSKVRIQGVDSPLGKALIDTLADVGVPASNQAESDQVLSITHALTVDDDGSSRKLSVEMHLGDVALKREYEQYGNRLSPTSGVLVRGYDPRHMVVMDEIFALSPTQAVNTLVARVEAQPGVFSRIPPPAPDTAVAPAERGLKQSRNVSEIGRSNYRGVLPGFTRHREEILVFGPDSMKLSAANAALIEDVVRDSDAEDYISVIGCSNGPTDIPNGNAILAQGRTQRVASALLYFGVEEHRILDESCWADKPLPPLPNRGVVLSVLRGGASNDADRWGEFF